jgi:uncharacterized protein (TIGR02646 family)
MKRVRKSHSEPQELADYRVRFAAAPRPPTWKEFTADPRRREPVKKRLREDQRGLCAYCENRLVPEDESVEHFVPKSADHARELDWSNLLLCCAGGERPLAEDLPDTSTRYDANSLKTCGRAKLGNPVLILNPLEIPVFPLLFRFNSETGAIQPDEGGCRSAGLDTNLAAQTIAVLGLHTGRLNRARLAVLEELLSQLASDGTAPAFSAERARELAARLIAATGNLPSFFTTIRWFLGAGAEAHLTAIEFQG